MSWFGELDPAPQWLREVVDIVLPDFQLPTPVDLELEFELARDEGDGILWVREAGQFGGGGFVVYPGEEARVELIIRFADWLQDGTFPESEAAWGEARPECAGHPHPATAVELDGEAWWVCPADGRRVAQIGHIGR